MNHLTDNDYLLLAALLGFLELMGIAIAIAVAIYISLRRARTEAQHYFYSPTFKPTSKTPKVVFIPAALLVSTLLVTIGVRDIWGPQFDARATFVIRAIFWLMIVGCAVQAILLIVTTRPLDDNPSIEGDPPDAE
jgi:hypothetical protein